MTHAAFMEKVSEGLVIEGFNSARTDPAEHINLDSYTLSDLECAVSMGKAGAAARPPKRVRSLHRQEHLLSEHQDGAAHVITCVPAWATKNAYCGFSECAHAAGLQGSSSHRHKQAPRAKATKGVWCMQCKRAFHAECYSMYHRLVRSAQDLEVPPPAKKAKRNGPHARLSIGSTSSSSSADTNDSPRAPASSPGLNSPSSSTGNDAALLMSIAA